MKLNTKGFTLIELLAVIIILAILMVFAVPNVLKIRQNATDKAGLTQAQSVFEAVETQVQNDILLDKTPNCYSSANASKTANIKDLGSATYYAQVKGGKVVYFQYKKGNDYYEAGVKNGTNEITKSEILKKTSTTFELCS